jgi:signal transduction histidine kinase
VEVRTAALGDASQPAGRELHRIECSVSDHQPELLRAFEKFTEASASLELSYRELANRVERLSRELDGANRRLSQTLAEKERIGAHLRAVLESLDSGVLVSDRHGRITHFNRVASRIFLEHGRDENAELPSLGRLSEVHPEMAAVLAGDGPASIEVVLSHVGRARCYLEVTRRELADERASGEGWVFVIRDLTRMRELEAQSQSMGRLAAMGEMALELAHEVRNPLGSIRLHASMLRSEPGLPWDGRRSLEQLEVGIRSLETVVSNMLAFGKPKEPVVESCDLRDLVTKTRTFLAPLTEERRVRVDLDFQAQAHEVDVEPEQFQQVLMNLWLNALRAMQGGGLLQVITRDAPNEPGSEGQEAGATELEIRDNGPGIAPDALCRVFDPHFTTDRKGSGLGLAVVSDIVERHGGRIRASSSGYGGTSFIITLPTGRVALAPVGAARGVVGGPPTPLSEERATN